MMSQYLEVSGSDEEIASQEGHDNDDGVGPITRNDINSTGMLANSYYYYAKSLNC